LHKIASGWLKALPRETAIFIGCRHPVFVLPQFIAKLLPILVIHFITSFFGSDPISLFISPVVGGATLFKKA